MSVLQLPVTKAQCQGSCRAKDVPSAFSHIPDEALVPCPVFVSVIGPVSHGYRNDHLSE